MARDFVPHPPQETLMRHIFEHPRNAGWMSMGGGKTSALLHAFKVLDTISPQWPILVMAPYRVARATWPNEVAKWSSLSGLRCSAIVGSREERLAALRKPAEIYTINYENIPWLVETLADSRHPWPFRATVADESTALQNFRLRQGGARAQALSKVAMQYSSRFVELSGTPTPNGLMGLWGQLYFLDAGERLLPTFEAFRLRYFHESRSGYGYIPTEFAKIDIPERVKDICQTIVLPWTGKPDIRPVYVELPSKARRHYDQMEKELFTELSSGLPVEALSAGAKMMKCMQIANGSVFVTDETGKSTREWEEIHDAKIQAVQSVVNEAAGMPVIIVYEFTHDLARLRRAFPKGRLFDSNPQTETDWNEGEIPQLFMHPAAGGHGSNLQDGGNIMAVMGHNFNLEQWLQVIERIGPARQRQSGYDRPTLIYPIYAIDTIDEVLRDRRQSKQSVMQALMDYTTRRTA